MSRPGAGRGVQGAETRRILLHGVNHATLAQVVLAVVAFGQFLRSLSATGPFGLAFFVSRLAIPAWRLVG